MDLFEKARKEEIEKEAPLAWRMCPRILEEFIGQEHILGEGKLLRRAIEADRLSSIILYGPPGTGKTALAKVIANLTKSEFDQLNAVHAKVEDIRESIKKAKERRNQYGKKTILFIDEIHRFNKLQQDALLPDVEAGNITMIGATTENPFFYVISALVSRSQVFQLEPLTPGNLETIATNALKDKKRGLGNFKVKMDPKALAHLIKASDGDARKVLSALEIGMLTTPPDKTGSIIYNVRAAEESIQKKKVVYDKKGDEHYDTISAFIKSMRGSDPDAALYWLAKMIYAGEDPRFIARRIVICAAEDVGNADPFALVLANAAMQVSEFVGLPEAQLPLAQAVTYIACAPKSNASTLAIGAAMEDIKNEQTSATFKGEKEMGHGVGYKYAHDYKNGYVKQDYMPHKKKYYEPKEIGHEKKIRERMRQITPA
jgi:putative ATPase